MRRRTHFQEVSCTPECPPRVIGRPPLEAGHAPDCAPFHVKHMRGTVRSWWPSPQKLPHVGLFQPCAPDFHLRRCPGINDQLFARPGRTPLCRPRLRRLQAPIHSDTRASCRNNDPFDGKTQGPAVRRNPDTHLSDTHSAARHIRLLRHLSAGYRGVRAILALRLSPATKFFYLQSLPQGLGLNSRVHPLRVHPGRRRAGSGRAGGPTGVTRHRPREDMGHTTGSPT